MTNHALGAQAMAQGEASLADLPMSGVTQIQSGHELTRGDTFLTMLVLMHLTLNSLP